MVVKCFFFFALLTFYACSSGENGLLELALDKSGENRSELEVVLDHYKDDLKKLEAARFLICNIIAVRRNFTKVKVGQSSLPPNLMKSCCLD